VSVLAFEEELKQQPPTTRWFRAEEVLLALTSREEAGKT
jgi:hypothetical protein